MTSVELSSTISSIISSSIIFGGAVLSLLYLFGSVKFTCDVKDLEYVELGRINDIVEKKSK